MTVPADAGDASRLATLRALFAPRIAEALEAGAGEPGAPARSALIPCLHAVQAAEGIIDDAVVAALADALNLSRAEVLGVAGFYSDFRVAPQATGEPPAHRVRLCAAEACKVSGGDRVRTALEAAVAAGGVRGVSVETVYCLGLCSVAPAALVDGVPVGRLTGEALIDALRAPA